MPNICWFSNVRLYCFSWSYITGNFISWDFCILIRQNKTFVNGDISLCNKMLNYMTDVATPEGVRLARYRSIIQRGSLNNSRNMTTCSWV